MKKLFRSKESQRLARLSALSAEREPAAPKPAPAVAPSAKASAPSEPTPPPAYALGGAELTFAASAALARPTGPLPSAGAALVAAGGDPFHEQTGELNFNRVGPYLILRKLGEGALGPVYLARRPDLAKPVALEVAPMARRTVVLPHFRKAAEDARNVRHEGLVGVVDASESEGLTLLALEYVAGDTLRVVLGRDAPLSEVRSLALATDLLQALVAIHAAGLVHLDACPETMATSNSGGRIKAKLSDLRFAVRAGEHAPPQPDFGANGAPNPRVVYAAPETLGGERVDSRTDLYSIGLVLFEALTGALPFSQASLDVLREQKLSLTPRSLGQARPERSFSPATEKLVARLLARDPAGRPPSASSVLRAVGEVVLPGFEGKADTARIGTRFDELFASPPK